MTEPITKKPMSAGRALWVLVRTALLVTIGILTVSVILGMVMAYFIIVAKFASHLANWMWH